MHHNHPVRTALLVFIFALFVPALPLAASRVDSSTLKALKARSIGPAGMSGRVTALAGDPSDRDVLYAGTASGGLWKSGDGGTSWKPIFDDQPVASIGAVAVDPSNPDVIWVGTGEGNPRNSQSVGNGVYRSRDGGKTWEHLGLEKSEHIHRLLIHPRNPQVVYVAALGPTWGEGQQRGVFRTRDGGRSWKRVLWANPRTGAADLVMDPRNPDKLIAALWEHRRWPWAFRSGGPGSGLYVTFDGGETWVRKTAKDGLPAGELGRIGLAIAPSHPQRVYALVEAKKSALYASEDGGDHWKKINDKPRVDSRPFYYSDIFVDPSNENRIFRLQSSLTSSEDGGKNFQPLVRGRTIHPDHHAFWINPRDPDFMMEGNDGGMAISRDGGKSWRFVENLPLGQFYHVNVDLARPYHIYGGLQDNGSWRGPAYVWAQGGIRNAYWRDVGFGDGFDVMPDATDPDWVYSMSQGGNLRRYNLRTGEQKTIRPPDPPGRRLRFNWNAALAADPFDPATLYYGSQFVHRSRDRGESWEIISPDLTSNDPEKQKQLESGGLTYDVTGAENYTTILTIAPSPVERGVLWVGTDDGEVSVTRDGGRNWTRVVSNIEGVPRHTWVPHIEASKFKGGEAFVVFDDHRRSNWTPYVFHTTDYGENWTSLVTKDLDGFVHVIEQDPRVPQLLFLGTEFHLYFSLDGGGSWQRWSAGLPTVAVRDLVVQPREGDLVVATFGRALYVIDDIAPLRELARQGASPSEEPLHLFPIRAAVEASYRGPPGVLFPGHADFQGENRPRGALITYRIQGKQPNKETGSGQAKKKEAKVRIEILSGKRVIRTLKGPATPGTHRLTWELDRRGVRLPGRFGRRRPRERGEPGGIPVPPGKYTVRLGWRGEQVSAPVQVLADPRRHRPPAAFEARSRLMDRWLEAARLVSRALARLEEADQTLKQVKERLKREKGPKIESLSNDGAQIGRHLEALRQRVVPKRVQGIRRDPSLLGSRLFRARSYAFSSWDSPNPSERQVMDQLHESVAGYLKEVNHFFAGEWEVYRKAIEAASIPLVRRYPPLKIRP